MFIPLQKHTDISIQKDAIKKINLHITSCILQFFQAETSFVALPNDHFIMARRGLNFAEQPIIARKCRQTVKGMIIFSQKLRLVITRNSFFA
jgi:hypothetical protein